MEHIFSFQSKKKIALKGIITKIFCISLLEGNMNVISICIGGDIILTLCEDSIWNDDNNNNDSDNINNNNIIWSLYIVLSIVRDQCSVPEWERSKNNFVLLLEIIYWNKLEINNIILNT